jgi:hypothetical protein
MKKSSRITNKKLIKNDEGGNDFKTDVNKI